MNNRGILMKNVMGIIIAVIGLAVFFAGVYGIYQVNKNQEIENAKKTLDNIIGKIELLQDGENNTFIIQGFTGSKDWYLVGWSKEEEIRQGKPEKCFFESCVCICKGERRDILGGNKFNGNACQNEGFCEFFDDRDVSVFSYYNALTHALGYDEGINTGATVSCIELGSNLIDVFVSKNQDKVEISYTDEKKTGFDPSICKLLSSEGYILS